MSLFAAHGSVVDPTVGDNKARVDGHEMKHLTEFKWVLLAFHL